jgi:predicted ferric reductase
MDQYIEFGWADVLVPGVASWEPTAVALGITSFYGLAVVTLSFYVKGLIGQNAWRAIHYLAFGTFVGALLHGILAGTDTANPVVTGMYVGMGVLAGGLLILRIVQQRSTREVPARSRTAAGRSGAEDSPNVVSAASRR